MHSNDKIFNFGLFQFIPIIKDATLKEEYSFLDITRSTVSIYKSDNIFRTFIIK